MQAWFCKGSDASLSVVLVRKRVVTLHTEYLLVKIVRNQNNYDLNNKIHHNKAVAGKYVVGRMLGAMRYIILEVATSRCPSWLCDPVSGPRRKELSLAPSAPPPCRHPD